MYNPIQSVNTASRSTYRRPSCQRPICQRFNLQRLILVFSAPLFFALGSCQEDAYNEPNPDATGSNAVNTAEIQSAQELSIIYPESNPGESSAFIQVAENKPNVTQVSAQDVPGSKLLYRLQDGEDMNKFVIDEETGNISFKQLPDWENPHDADKNNNYMLLWQVLSSTGKAESQFLVIQVTDLPED